MKPQIFIGVGITILFELFLFGGLIASYKLGLFKDDGAKKIGIIKIDYGNSNGSGMNEIVAYKLQQLDRTIKLENKPYLKVLNKSGDNIKILFEQKIELSKVDLYNYSVIKEIEETKNERLKQFLLLNYNIYLEKKGKLDYGFNKFLTRKLFFQTEFKEYTGKKKQPILVNINNRYNKLLNFVYSNLNNVNDKNKYTTISKIEDLNKKIVYHVNQFYKKNNKLVKDYCYNNFCKLEVYDYIRSAILADKMLNRYLNKYSKEFGIDKKIALSVLIIENIRQHTTYKGMFKQFFVGLPIPKLSIMSKFSYGLFGMKLGALEKVINYGEDKDKGKVIQYIIDNYCEYNADKNIYKITKKQEFIDYFVKNKRLQVYTFFKFLKQQKEIRRKAGIDFDMIEKEQYITNIPGVIATIWNIGGKKKPHKDYDTGGSRLEFEFLGYGIYFGDLANRIYFSNELDLIK